MLIRLQALGDGDKTALKVVPSSLLDLLHHAAGQPFEQDGILLGEGIQHPVHAFRHKGILVKLHLI